MEPEQPSPFAVLGVDLDAEDVAVRRAYAAQLRRMRAEKDKDGEMKVQAAFEILRDASSRREARQWVEKGGDVQRLMTAAMKDFADGNPEPALGALREVLELMPGFGPALSLYVRVEISRGNHDAAIARLEALVEHEPEEWKPRHLVASALCDKADSMGGAGVRLVIYERALRELQGAKARGADTADVVVLEARLLAALSKGRESVALLRNALATSPHLGAADQRLWVALLERFAVDGNRTAFWDLLGRIEREILTDSEQGEVALVALTDLFLRTPMQLGTARHDLATFLNGVQPDKEFGKTLLGQVAHEAVVLEAHEAWGRSQPGKAEQILRDAVAAATDLRAVAPVLWLTLLQCFCNTGNRAGFQNLLERIERELLSDPEHRDLPLQALVKCFRSMPPQLGPARIDLARFIERAHPDRALAGEIARQAEEEWAAARREPPMPPATLAHETTPGSWSGWIWGFLAFFLLMGVLRSCARMAG